MTLSTQTSRIEYTANGSQATFNYSFEIFQTSDMKVYKDGVLQTSGYSVTGVGNDNGGTVVFSTAPASGVVVRLARVTAKVQELVLREFQKIPVAAVEKNFDKIVAMIQELAQSDSDINIELDGLQIQLDDLLTFLQSITLQPSAQYVGETQPEFGFQGMRWYNPSTPATYVYYYDGDSGQWVQEAHEGVDGALRSDLKQSLSFVQIGDITAGQIAMALKNTVTPEQFGTGADNIQLAINYCSSIGGGTVLLGAKTYNVTAPVEMKRKVNLIGISSGSSFVKKSVASTVDGIDAILVARDAELANHFRVENICLIGNRTNKAAGNTVTTNGIWFNYAHFYSVKNIRVEQCLEAFVLNQNYVAILDRITGLMCQGYAFHSYNGCTTLSVSNALSWGCGGGYKIEATIYSTFRDCACDHSDAGGRVDDPFLPEGSGGNYLNPNYIWEISASRITVTGAGCENSYSKWLYGEGAFVDFINPYVFNMEGHGTPYRAIEIRGTGKSRVNITNAKFDIRLGLPASTARRMYYIDSPRNQTIMMDVPVSGDAATFGDFAHPVRGVVFSETIPLMNFTQESMIVGQTLYPLIYTAANIEPTTTLVSNTKRLNITNKTTTYQVIRLPIDYEGTLEVIAQGSHSSGYDVFQLRVVGWDGTNTDIVKTIQLSGAFDKREYVYLGEGATAATTKPLYLELRGAHSSDVTYFTNLKVSRIK